MAQTEHYNLYLESGGETTFQQWREAMNGPSDSNMVKIDNALAGKQDKLAGATGQVVGFDEDGNAVAQDAPEGGVVSFNGRKGEVSPQNGDYTADMVGARPSTWTPTPAEVGASPIGHKHTTSEITDFPASLPASDVSAWAKAAAKPTYTASEVGAKASGWKPFSVGTSAPSDTTQLWIDTANQILKYHNGSAWVAVPVAWG